MNILEKINADTHQRVKQYKSQIPLAQMRRLASSAPTRPSFKNALIGNNLKLILEVKKASPSKGILIKDFSPAQIALSHINSGAAAISVLTEPLHFLGADEYLQKIANITQTPLLRKDFIVDEYMIYQAKTLSASAILLIVASLSKSQIAEYFAIAKSLELDVLVECHDEAEVETALACNADIIGVNNRNLKTFKVDIGTSLRLRKLVPRDIIFVAESGISTKADLETLKQNNVNAALIGEHAKNLF